MIRVIDRNPSRILDHLKGQATEVYDAIQLEDRELAIITLTELLVIARGEAQQEVFDHLNAAFAREGFGGTRVSHREEKPS